MVLLSALDVSAATARTAATTSAVLDVGSDNVGYVLDAATVTGGRGDGGRGVVLDRQLRLQRRRQRVVLEVYPNGVHWSPSPS